MFYSPNPVKIGHNSLDIVTSCRYLGVQIDNKLTFSNHIKLVTGKIAKSTIQNTSYTKLSISYHSKFVLTIIMHLSTLTFHTV